MKKINLILITLLALMIGVGTGNSAILDNYWSCRSIAPSDWNDFTQPVDCIEPTSEFLTTEEAAFILVKLSSIAEGDEIAVKVSDPSGNPVIDDFQTSPASIGTWYDYRKISIAGENRQTGEYPVKVYINGVEVTSNSFTIKEDLSNKCQEAGFYCCPSPKLCISAKEEECASGMCCESEDKCVTYSPNYFSRTEITNCEEKSLNGCGKVVKLYEYNIHGRLAEPQTAVIYYRDINVDCGDKKDITIAYYNDETGIWVEKATSIEKAEAEGSYKATALLDHLGYVALIRTKECVPILCTYGGYRTTPIGAYVNFGENITFEICGIISGCQSIKDGTCNKKCTDGVDPDCPECTPNGGDCCSLSYDGICDPDCAPSVDPDCCDKSKELCCSGNQSESPECDKNCGTSDTSCTGCTANGGDCCNSIPATGNMPTDGICDPDCPKLSNGVGYVDVDCCAPNSIAVNSQGGDCCNVACDVICDPDCIAGLDPDCYTKGTACGDGYCDRLCGWLGCTADERCALESCFICPQDCGTCVCGDGQCTVDENYQNCYKDCHCGDNTCDSAVGETIDNCYKDCGCGDGVCKESETCSNCQKDCGDCPPSGGDA